MAVKNPITDNHIVSAARELGVHPALVAAFLEVECRWPRWRGFDRAGRVRILWERHKCWKYASKAERMKLPRSICNPRPGGYARTNAGNWKRLNIAYEVMGSRAYLAASWGLGQIMGFNYERAGFSSVEDFVEAMKAGEVEQLEAMVRFLKSDKTLLGYMRRYYWHGIARRYNGKNYAKGRYHIKLRKAFNKFVKARDWDSIPPIEDVEEVKVVEEARKTGAIAGKTVAEELRDQQKKRYVFGAVVALLLSLYGWLTDAFSQFVEFIKGLF